MSEFYKAGGGGVGGPGGACSPAHCSLYWATAAVGLITQLDSFQRLHDEEADDSDSWHFTNTLTVLCDSPMRIYNDFHSFVCIISIISCNVL